MSLFEKITQKERDDKEKQAIALIDEAVAETPKLAEQLSVLKFKLLDQSGNDEAALSFGRKLVETTYKDEPQALNFIGWQIVDPQKKAKAGQQSVKLALQAATRADELTKGENPAIIDTLARVYFEMGDRAKAIELQEKAVKLDKGQMKELADTLEQYRKAAKEKP